VTRSDHGHCAALLEINPAWLLGILLSFAMSAASQEPLNAPCKHTVTGQLQVFRFDSKVFGNTQMLRVWLPPGFDNVANSTRRYPCPTCLKQDLFDACSSALNYSMIFRNMMGRD
jgi:hypothetical protein